MLSLETRQKKPEDPGALSELTEGTGFLTSADFFSFEEKISSNNFCPIFCSFDSKGNLATLGTFDSTSKPRRKHDTMSLKSTSSVGRESSKSSKTDVVRKSKKKDREKDKDSGGTTLDPEAVKEFQEFHDAVKMLDSFGSSSTLPRNFTFKSETDTRKVSTASIFTHALKSAASDDNLLKKKKKKKPLDYSSSKVLLGT